ncbi:MAG: glycosyl hydrolase 108 family protein [Pseudomonadota bacterium]
MSNYTQARDELDQALNYVTPDGPEWIKINAAIAALDQAEVAEIERDFVNASRRVEDATDKLKSVVAGLSPNMASNVIDKVTGALQRINPVIRNVNALLSGEPASALPGMAEANKPVFPTPDEPSVPPLREYARDIAATPAAGGTAVSDMIEDILRREGGFVDHPADRGGPTNFGITLSTLASSRGAQVTRDDVRRMTQAEAQAIYETRYYTGPKINLLAPGFQPLVFDMAINHGPGTSIMLLQQTLGACGQACAVDGGIGNETINAANSALLNPGQASFINALVDRRIELFKAIASKDPSQKVFLKGWLNRAKEFRV